MIICQRGWHRQSAGSGTCCACICPSNQDASTCLGTGVAAFRNCSLRNRTVFHSGISTRTALCCGSRLELEAIQEGTQTLIHTHCKSSGSSWSSTKTLETLTSLLVRALTLLKSILTQICWPSTNFPTLLPPKSSLWIGTSLIIHFVNECRQQCQSWILWAFGNGSCRQQPFGHQTCSKLLSYSKSVCLHAFPSGS